MRLLLTAATSLEIEPAIQYLNTNWKQSDENDFSKDGNELHVLITGAGILLTTYQLSTYFQQFHSDLAIQAGLAGSFHKDIPLGSVVVVTREIFGDTGAEDGDHFLDIFDIGLWNENAFPFEARMLINPMDMLPDLTGFKMVTGLTVNKVGGQPATIAQRSAKYHPDTESMEGGAFHFVCLQEKIPFLQLRAISNYVEPRDKTKWNIPLAIKQLNYYLTHLLEKY